MPIKKIEIHGLNPEHPIATVIDEINANLDNIIAHIDGIDSETGVVGPTGAKGDKGDTGQQGIEGPAGKDGKDGIDGKDGKDGSPGLNGQDGKDGLPGEQGPAGKDGKDGKDGQPGRDGLPGRDGVDGKDGKDGLPGIPGPKGDKGEQGIQGVPGKDGKDGLPGAPGKDGLPGAPGPQGVAGPAGAQGLKGDKGDTGAMGPVGSPGAMNTVTYTGAVATVNAIGQTVAQMTFTSNGYPVVCIANGDANPNSQAWIQLQWYRDGVAIGNKFHLESSGNNINCHYNIITPDTPTAGAHVYSLRTAGVMSGSWTFGEGGGPQLTFIEMSGATGPQGPAGTGIKGFASGYVDAGQFVTLDNLKFSVTTGGQRGLCCATVSGTATLSISANYALCGGANGGATAYPGASYNTTPSGSWFGWSFPNAGDGSTYLVNDYTNQRFYRVTLMIGAAYLKNFISIERLG